MKRSLTFIAIITGLYSNAQLVTGVEPIIHNEAYVIHSELRIDTTLQNTSSIFAIKGTNDTVWLASMGYGDPRDLRVYRDCTAINTSLIQDAHLVDSCIQLMGVSSPKLMFVAVHFHLDHCNQEFFFMMDSIYGTMPSKIYIHRNDYGAAICNLYCCSGLPCVQGSQYFGAPYDWSWTNPTLAKFKTIGGKQDPCGKVLKYITTSYGGWKITKASNIHTPGCINLDCDSLNIRISGSDISGTCLPPLGWDLLPAHGNAQVDSVYNFSGGGGGRSASLGWSYWWWLLCAVPLLLLRKRA